MVEKVGVDVAATSVGTGRGVIVTLTIGEVAAGVGIGLAPKLIVKLSVAAVFAVSPVVSVESPTMTVQEFPEFSVVLEVQVPPPGNPFGKVKGLLS